MHGILKEQSYSSGRNIWMRLVEFLCNSWQLVEVGEQRGSGLDCKLSKKVSVMNNI